MKYLEDEDLMYEIILSKGKGELTEKGKRYLYLIASNAIWKKKYSYKDYDEMYDVMMHSYMLMLSSWKTFNEEKYKFALPYFTELFKRGCAAGYYLIRDRKNYHYEFPDKVSVNKCYYL